MLNYFQEAQKKTQSSTEGIPLALSTQASYDSTRGTKGSQQCHVKPKNKNPLPTRKIKHVQSIVGTHHSAMPEQLITPSLHLLVK